MRKTISKKIKLATVRSLAEESDAGCVTLGAAILDDLLSHLHYLRVLVNLKKGSANKFFDEKLANDVGPLSTFSAKTNLAFGYGFITHDEFTALNIIRRLRNEAAHAAFEFRFSDEGVKAHVRNLSAVPTEKNILMPEGTPDMNSLPEAKREFISQVWRLIRQLEKRSLAYAKKHLALAGL